MTTQKNLNWHIKRTIVLGLPIVAVQILQMLIGVTDSLMVARLGELPLAQITLGTQVTNFFIFVALGFSIPIGPIVGTSIARGDEQTTRRAVRMGIWQAVLLSVIFVPVGMMAKTILLAMGQELQVVEGSVAYIYVAVWALPFIFIGNALRGYLLALERNRLLMLVALAGALVNFIGNYALIFGHFGMPRLGLVGSAWATLLTNAAMFLVSLWIVFKEPLTSKVELFRNPFRSDWAMFWRLTKLGLPAAGGILSEVGLFQAGTLVMGLIGVTELAAYGLVLLIACLSFMVPVGFSVAASIRAGQALGHADHEELQLVIKSNTIVILSFMIATALLYLLAPHALISMVIEVNDPKNAELVRLSVSYFIFAAAFQITDGAQVGAMSILRGLQDMLIPALLAFIAYWGIGMTSAVFFGFKMGWGGQGVWLGLVLGLSFAAIFLWMRLFKVASPEAFDARVASL